MTLTTSSRALSDAAMLIAWTVAASDAAVRSVARRTVRILAGLGPCTSVWGTTSGSMRDMFVSASMSGRNFRDVSVLRVLFHSRQSGRTPPRRTVTIGPNWLTNGPTRWLVDWAGHGYGEPVTSAGP